LNVTDKLLFVIFQATESVLDNSVITECFEVAPKRKGEKHSKRKSDDCCHKCKCWGRSL